MTDGALETDVSPMQLGHEMLQQGNLQGALAQFRGVAEQKPVTQESISGMQMMGVTLRLMGRLNQAEQVLYDAWYYAEFQSDDLLTAKVLRDYGAVLHAKVWKKRLRALAPYDGGYWSWSAKQVRRAYQESFNILRRLLKNTDLSEEERNRLTAEMWTTYGFMGMYDAEFEEESGQLGRLELMDASAVLRSLGNQFEIYLLNNQIRLMRVSNLADRFGYLKEALELTSKTSQSPGARKRVWVALFGNHVYHFFAKGA